MSKTFEELDASLPENIRALSAMHITERKALHELCRNVPENGVVVEVGCQLGCSSAIISSVSYERKYRAIHIDPYTQQGDYLKGWTELMMGLVGDWDHAFCLLCMRTAQAEWYLSKLLSEGVDLAFIDGDHMEDGVRIDMKLVASKIRPGGYLAAHDYSEWQFPGVPIAVDEYVGRGGWEKVGHYHSMGVWRRL